MLHDTFINRYKSCLKPKLPCSLDSKEYCQRLLTSIYPRIAPSLIKRLKSKDHSLLQWFVGNTRVYLRQQEVQIVLDEYRKCKLIITMQCIRVLFNNQYYHSSISSFDSSTSSRCSNTCEDENTV